MKCDKCGRELDIGFFKGFGHGYTCINCRDESIGVISGLEDMIDGCDEEYYAGFASPRYKRHSELLGIIHETYKKKNAAYGNSFDRSIDRYGFVAALVRIEDKINRLEQLLLNGKEGNDESAMDTALDLASYAVMTAMRIESKQ